ncbi:MAG: adenylate/guanylate cyclase domain-containing protein [Leptospirales bacterium]|nr:adenylate/guanylate cyclase domain-containing protein [Leptospirales bacterium]
MDTPRRILALLVSGIRAKLAWFTAFLILVTVLFLSIIYLQQQQSIQTESYDREAAISRRYISALVLEIDNISQSLVRTEEFRIRIREQREALKRYRSTRIVSQEKEVSLFGIRTSLFGALGRQNVRRTAETYYSAYLSDDEVDALEASSRAQLQGSGGEGISDLDFSRLQALAKDYVTAENNVQDARRALQEAEQRATETLQGAATGGGAQPSINPALAQKVKEGMDRARQARLRLDSRIAQLMAGSRKRKIKELGLDTGRFRIQTFPTGAITGSESSQPTLDTSLFDPESKLNQSLADPDLESSLSAALDSLSQTLGLDSSLTPTQLELGEMQLQALYSPYFRNPQSTERARSVETLRAEAHEWQHYLELDANYAAKLGDLSKKIAQRLEELRKQRPPTPPFRDTQFRQLYSSYAAIVAERNKAFAQQAAAESSADAAAPVDRLADAVGNLREAALEDGVLLRFREDSAAYDSYLRDALLRQSQQERWQKLRQWIYAGESETPDRGLSRAYSEGIIGNSRTEAEQIMWRLDSSPLLASDSEDVSQQVLGRNFAGVIRTLVDRTRGLEEIKQNRNRAILYASGIAALSILFAIFISGFVVQKIKRIIKSAEDVGRGSLNVQFEHGGNDEFGNLTIALNSMVSGLRDREKIKGILGSMVDPVVVTEAMKDLQALKRGSEKRITAFFSDVASFSTISEKLSSVELAALLNEYLSAMTLILKEHEGVLDKYIGDAIVGIWNAPVDVDHHCLKAVQATLRMVDCMIEMRARWTKEQKYIPEARTMRFRVGLNTGLAKVGFMGTDALAAYTMMGDTVNLAARLEAAGKDYGIELLASEAVYREVSDKIFARKLDLVRVKGKTEPVALYEIISDSPRPPEARARCAEQYEAAFALYLKRQWRPAIAGFEQAIVASGGKDKAADLLIQRCRMYEAAPPPHDWDGVYTREHK